MSHNRNGFLQTSSRGITIKNFIANKISTIIMCENNILYVIVKIGKNCPSSLTCLCFPDVFHMCEPYVGQFPLNKSHEMLNAENSICIEFTNFQ